MKRTLQQDWQEAGVIARAVVAKRVTILTTLGLIVGILVREGLIPDGLSNRITHWSTVALTLLGVAAGVLWAQRGVTPADPQLRPTDVYGNPLVSELSVGPHAGREPAPGALTALDNPPPVPEEPATDTPHVLNLTKES